MSPSSLPPQQRREHCPGELLLLSDRPTVPHGIERPRQLPGTICAPSAEREMSTPHPPAGSGTRTPTTRGRSPPLTARSSSKRKQWFDAALLLLAEAVAQTPLLSGLFWTIRACHRTSSQLTETNRCSCPRICATGCRKTTSPGL